MRLCISLYVFLAETTSVLSTKLGKNDYCIWITKKILCCIFLYFDFHSQFSVARHMNFFSVTKLENYVWSKGLLFFITISTNCLHDMTHKKWITDFRGSIKLKKERSSSVVVFLINVLLIIEINTFSVSDQCIDLYCSLPVIKLANYAFHTVSSKPFACPPSLHQLELFT